MIEAKLRRAIMRAEDGAGTLPAKESVKLRPREWHRVCDLGREAADALAAKDARIAEMLPFVEMVAAIDAPESMPDDCPLFCIMAHPPGITAGHVRAARALLALIRARGGSGTR